MTAVYADARQVHSALARALAPTLAPSGWRRQSGRTCTFTRTVASETGHWLLWAQVSQFGNRDLGNEFTLNVERQHEPGVHPGGGPHARILGGLDETDRALGLALEARIVARKPRPAADRPIHEHLRQDTTGQLRAGWERAFNAQPDRWRAGGDPWLVYYSVDDVAEWCTFLSGRLAALLERR